MQEPGLPAIPPAPRPGNRRSALVGLLLIFIVAAALRLSHLELKVLSGDEIYSALRLSGNSMAQVERDLGNGQANPVEAWQRQLQRRPGSSAMDTIRSLALEAPEHPPLFYLTARAWQGHSLVLPNALRLLPALYGIALIPAVALLAWEMWRSPSAAILSATLVSVCPVHVLYSQELREYSLWSTLTPLVAWLLLRALRLRRRGDWILYGLALTLLLYAQVLSLDLLVAFSLLPLLKAWRRSRLALLLTHAGALIAFSPWIWVATQGEMLRRGSNLWTASSLPFPLLSWNWGLNLTRLWLDLDPGGRILSGDTPVQNGLRALAVAATTIGTLLAWAWILRQQDRRPAALMLAMLLGAVLPLIAADLLLGGSRSSVPRYPQPGYLAVQMTVAGALAQLWWQRRALGLAITALIVALGLHSSLNLLGSPFWWNKLGSIDQGQIAREANRWPGPLLMSEGYLPRLLSLSTQLRSDAALQVLPGEMVSGAPVPVGRPLLLYRPSEAWLELLKGRLSSQGESPTFRELARTPSRYPYVPSVDRHTRLWLVLVERSAAAAPIGLPSAAAPALGKDQP